MNDTTPNFWKIFFEVYEALPRQGPGDFASAARALSFCRHLPDYPNILDLGCGVGGQTFHLAELTSGTILAMDSHAPSIKKLQKTITERGLESRISAQVGDMANPGLELNSFDLVWSEGALYNIGIGNALRICHGLLRPGGYLAFTDAVWCRENPPPEVKSSFDEDYPDMGWTKDVLAAIEACGFEQKDRFSLPKEAWWTDFYTPMQHRIDELRLKYVNDNANCSILDQIAQEPETHRLFSDYYAYEFFIVRRR